MIMTPIGAARARDVQHLGLTVHTREGPAAGAGGVDPPVQPWYPGEAPPMPLPDLYAKPVQFTPRERHAPAGVTAGGAASATTKGGEHASPSGSNGGAVAVPMLSGVMFAPPSSAGGRQGAADEALLTHIPEEEEEEEEEEVEVGGVEEKKDASMAVVPSASAAPPTASGKTSTTPPTSPSPSVTPAAGAAEAASSEGVGNGSTSPGGAMASSTPPPSRFRPDGCEHDTTPVPPIKPFRWVTSDDWWALPLNKRTSMHEKAPYASGRPVDVLYIPDLYEDIEGLHESLAPVIADSPDARLLIYQYPGLPSTRYEQHTGLRPPRLSPEFAALVLLHLVRKLRNTGAWGPTDMCPPKLDPYEGLGKDEPPPCPRDVVIIGSGLGAHIASIFTTSFVTFVPGECV